jgi:myo-inositol-1(or 4)-monophosphatase
MQPLLNIAIQAARQAGDIIIRHADQVDRLSVMEKGHHDYFSEVDVKAEQAILQVIHKAHPDHGIMAEESGSIRDDAECVWIIDPLDGTNNYLHGFPFYAVSIAIQIKGRIEHAVVYDPIRHECFSASRGRGARLNDRRLRVSKQTQLDASVLGVGLKRSQHHKNYSLSTFQSLFDQCMSVRRTGSVALELAYVASGRLDGFLGAHLKPWDIAAGSLLIQEAGGFISDYEEQGNFLQHGNIIASTPKLFKPILQTLNVNP